MYCSTFSSLCAFICISRHKSYFMDPSLCTLSPGDIKMLYGKMYTSLLNADNYEMINMFTKASISFFQYLVSTDAEPSVMTSFLSHMSCAESVSAATAPFVLLWLEKCRHPTVMNSKLKNYVLLNIDIFEKSNVMPSELQSALSRGKKCFPARRAFRKYLKKRPMQ